MEPFYFGERDRRLFGVFHPPKAGRERRHGVVICPPWGDEAIRAHRSLLCLADGMANVGFPTLRFDFWGTGDSDGESASVTLGSMISDVSVAVDELLGGTEIESVSLAGLRLGAAVAALAAKAVPCLAALVLWNPVLRGWQFLEEMRATHQQWREGSMARVRTERREFEEVLGFPLSEALRKELLAIDLADEDIDTPNALVVAEHTEEVRQFVERLTDRGATVTENVPVEAPIWEKSGDALGKQLVAARTLETVVTWISTVEP